MKQTIIFIVHCASYILAKGQDSLSKTSNKPIETGFVFIDGKYIEPPYIFTFNDSIIFLNNVQIKKNRTLTYGKELMFDHDPGVPPEINKNSTLTQFFTSKEPTQGKSYFMAIQGYYYSHFSAEEANLKVINYIKNLPNVKSFSNNKGLWTIESYSGDKDESISSGVMEIMNKTWGPNGSGLPSTESNIKNLLEKIERFKRKLAADNLIIFSNSKGESFFAKATTKQALADIISICDSNISTQKKVEYLIEKKIFKASDTSNANSFIKKFNISNTGKSRIRKASTKANTDDTNDIFKKENIYQKNSNSNLNKLNNNIGNNSVKSTTSTTSCYSPMLALACNE